MDKTKAKIIECPRDAMQGIHAFIPTNDKIKYINQLLTLGFDTLDFGSFVSPKAIPQMRDTAKVLGGLNLTPDSPSLLAIVANERGAKDAVAYDEIAFLGFPFSISEIFQQRNTNASIEESLQRVEAIQSLCIKHEKTLVIYVSMAFGNPYNEPWHPDIATKWATRLYNELDIKIVAMSDTIGAATPEQISDLFSTIIPELPSAEIGAHLHTKPNDWEAKIQSAYKAGCRRFDGALKGFGGCPMAKDDLTGNMPTEHLIDFLESKKAIEIVDKHALQEAMRMAEKIMRV